MQNINIQHAEKDEKGGGDGAADYGAEFAEGAEFGGNGGGGASDDEGGDDDDAGWGGGLDGVKRRWEWEGRGGGKRRRKDREKIEWMRQTMHKV